jgi:hypothetical protein
VVHDSRAVGTHFAAAGSGPVGLSSRPLGVGAGAPLATVVSRCPLRCSTP